MQYVKLKTTVVWLRSGSVRQTPNLFLDHNLNFVRYWIGVPSLIKENCKDMSIRHITRVIK